MWQASQQMQCVMLSFLGSFWKFNTWSLAMAIIVCLNTALVLLALIFLINFISWFSSSQEPWLISMLTFHAILLLVTIISRRNINFQLILSALTFSGVFLAERINTFLGQNWKSFSSQNYFDPQGLFISVVWSGPLLLITILILVNTLVTLCMLIVRWKRAELRHRARQARNKQDWS